MVLIMSLLMNYVITISIPLLLKCIFEPIEHVHHQVPGLQQQYIATQVPLTDTVADFWQMVKHYRCLALVYTDVNGPKVCNTVDVGTIVCNVAIGYG